MATHAIAHDVDAEEIVVVHRILVLGALRSDIRTANSTQQKALDRNRTSVRYHDGASAQTGIVRSTPRSRDTFLIPSPACSAVSRAAPSTVSDGPCAVRERARALRETSIRSSAMTRGETPAPRR